MTQQSAWSIWSKMEATRLRWSTILRCIMGFLSVIMGLNVYADDVIPQEHLASTHTIISDSADISVSEIKHLTLISKTLELKVSTQTSLELNALLSNNSTQVITQNIEWIVANPTIITISNNTLQALKEGTTTLQARYGKVLSNTLNITVYLEISRHRLPPEPDAKVNNATLLGIDSNHNGVRDDVERKIYFRYKKPVIQAFMMQSAKSYPKYLEDPIASAKAQETQDEMWKEGSCSGYLEVVKKIEMPNVEGLKFLSNAYMNTKERIKAYIKFNEALSGGSYAIPLIRDYKKENCDFNVEEMLEIEK
ncbi:hypothetical protein FA592_11240 [Sulfurospirillum diekertiae]|uniref:Uncharacterized protein n=1 Tax=Sulfurospirillum diekertiae TaxID=1854492 RepID=A0A6G9VT98_9BACT|nr:hypothetical protein [Sulfurospirillum diekertiae]QIR76764.1 hypothetical protein FA584_11375 [Sulfurospirillum diekertiae]QIR79395.1 hypothetical protein FA592_11240 [Sulfurospirillum diekertiae]